MRGKRLQGAQADLVLNVVRDTPRGSTMKIILASLLMLSALSGCISSSSPPPPQKSTTVVVPPSSGTAVICSDGTNPPCH
jgi:hypothetical protein